MGAQVSFHPETFSKFFAPIDKLYPGLSADLLRDFASYIDSDRIAVPEYFGRDAPYTQPVEASNAHLMHIHIKLPPGKFPKNRAQYYRVCNQGKPEEDACLVYVRGELEEDMYMILAFFWPDAHEMARDPKQMKYLARLAKDFRDTN
ncbi:type II toxin-antitoxin system YafO family toxin [Pseudomonas aeruginosa]|uniref:mRNA interferase YafO n=1 Tax=Pseudomonas aeruginosa TaxID=287 RepID=A0A643EMI0_PSEAI|nr:type II toxin-antitoxin system YafO family toxin [Pseudomonas aeruginosa]DBA08735.1 TPA_asm: Type II toxin-antitoxin system YafO family toxin [Pseudomonas phage vB_PaeS-D14L]EKX2035519.1 type II toxin-antitoxin system YafO family toxin [Pseudomonas aeruginosa]KAB0561463.1 hypothetical protein F7R07_06245 [Pseudomonas aeruginosa]KSN45990.1 hypothetical protein APA86_30475 [Pseudomonas aeruginosa]KSN63071.1 hypothetical protein APA89_12035 [Pseudomonas aeruginosa]